MLSSKVAATTAADGRANFKAYRVQQLKGRSSAPARYTSNTTKEELCMEYVRQFVRQLMRRHPKRPEPFVIAQNEHGVDKFVCTYISPTQNAFSELYDVHSCASFFSGYVQYEPLQEPTQPPTTLLSPTQLLEWHTGDAFDIAHLLCSCLIGAGYDAYVCYGTAPKRICLKDQSRLPCPMLDKIASTADGKTAEDDSTADEQKADSGSYCYVDDKQSESVYLAHESERKRQEAANHFSLWIEDPEDDEEEAEKEEDDPLYNQRLHAWVLVRRGKREVQEDMFLEPATGRAFRLSSSCPFISWHAAYNDVNYWINDDVDIPIHQLDAHFRSGWTAMFVERASESKYSEDDEEDAAAAEGKSGRLRESEDVLDLHNDDVILERVLEVPRSWVGEVAVTRQQYQLRYPPDGSRMTLYSKSSVDLFAKGTHAQGLVMRVTLYLDRERVKVKEIHEWFENRTDKLYRRSRYPLENKSHEFFRPGSVGEIKEWIEYSGRKRTVHFYVSGRLDRLKRREEDIGNKSMDFFEGRDDHLIYRSAVYTSENRDDTGLKTSYPVPSAGPTSELFVVKMTEKFSRNEKVPAKQDIAKRTFYCHDGRVLIHYHYEDGAITRATKTIVQSRAQSLATAASASASQDEVHQASIHERACWVEVKAMCAQMLQFAKLRRTAESHVLLEKNVFETARERVEKSGHSRVVDEKAKTTNTRELDYLTPFIRNVADPTMLTMAEAMEVRQACLDALRGRLLERANIIQSRLNEENNKLARKQEQFQRSQRDGDLTIEEYEKYCTEAMFRIQILEQRLVAHEEAAIKKYKDLDAKLQADPRLAALHGGR